MSTYKFLTVEIKLALSDTQHVSLHSKMSLLDWDIILIKPDIGSFYSYAENYQGKPCLDDSSSFQLKECCEHWRREIKQAVETGKTVVVYLPELEEVYVDTGQRTYSGTGRNRQTTRQVKLYTNYEAIPASLSPVATTGSSMKLTARGAEIVAPYWAEFERFSNYQVLLTDASIPTCIATRSGDKPVGALYRSKTSRGSLLLLPDIEFRRDEFLTQKKGGKQEWTPAAVQFAGQLVTSIVAIEAALRSTSEMTPQPPWASNSRFVLGPEAALRIQLLEVEQRVEKAQKDKEDVLESLGKASRFRALLFEKGKPLEHAIIEALRLMGFVAAPFKDSESEFDVVFECDEGRLIGEAEGKDNKAVNVDKLRQLSMNIHEDLQREDVTTPAKPVLFGNGFRLQTLEERPDPFTEKCQSAAATSSTALVFTADLFVIVQYLIDRSAPEFCRECRNALLQSTGRVVFPEVPASEFSPLETQIHDVK